MKCPNCLNSVLQSILTRQGVEVDRCAMCKGIWLDRGEIFLFARDPKDVTGKLKAAMASRMPTDKRSPRTNTPMEEIGYADGVRINYCSESGGLWFDAHELSAIFEREPGLRLEYDQVFDRPSVPVVKAAALLPLPNLLLRSTFTLVGLYAVLALALIAAAELSGIDLKWAVGGALFAIALQFLIGPFIMDLMLGWLYSMRWLSGAEIPLHLNTFIARVCSQHGMSPPRVGLIDDGAPQAFAYGRTPPAAIESEYPAIAHGRWQD